MDRDDVSLQDYLLVLRRKRWVVVLTTVLVFVAAVGVSLVQTPVYEATTELAVEPVRRTQDVSLEQLLEPTSSSVETERIVLTSRPVAERAAAELGVSDVSSLVEDVRVEVLNETTVVRIVASDTDPAVAVATADAFADAYLDFRRDQAVDEVLSARANLDERGADLREQIAVIEQDLDGAEDDEAQTLGVQREALLAQLTQVVAQSSELGETAEAITGGGAVLTPAEAPSAPASPRPLRTGALALVLGLLLGVGLAFLRDHVDDVIRDENDFKRATGGRPILGRIPTYQDDVGDRLVTVLDPAAVASESYRELSAGIRFLLVTHGGPAGGSDPDGAPSRGRAVMMASANAGEGKTSSASNLAVAAARVGLRTVLVDTDLRKATVGRRFGLGRTTGLSDVLLSGGDVAAHLQDVGINNLRVLPAGTIPPNPAELLASPAMRALQHELVSQADLVIYDTPAVLAVPDALELGRFVDLSILVARAGVTSRRQLAAAVERLEQVGTDLAGTVLNDIDTKADGYYYAYYYQAEDDADSRQTGSSDDAEGPVPTRRAQRRAAERGRGRGRGRGRRQRRGSAKRAPEPAVPTGRVEASTVASTVTSPPQATVAPAPPAPPAAAPRPPRLEVGDVPGPAIRTPSFLAAPTRPLSDQRGGEQLFGDDRT